MIHAKFMAFYARRVSRQSSHACAGKGASGAGGAPGPVAAGGTRAHLPPQPGPAVAHDVQATRRPAVGRPVDKRARRRRLRLGLRLAALQHGHRPRAHGGDGGAAVPPAPQVIPGGDDDPPGPRGRRGCSVRVVSRLLRVRRRARWRGWVPGCGRERAGRHRRGSGFRDSVPSGSGRSRLGRIVPPDVAICARSGLRRIVTCEAGVHGNVSVPARALAKAQR